MDERDPISEWQNAILRRLSALAFVLILTACVLCLIAPLFGPAIKIIKLHDYVMFDDYEARAEADMKIIRPFLWVVAIIAWIIFIICYNNYY